MTERYLTPAMLQAMLAEETEHVPLCLLKISHASLTDDIRIVANTENIIFESEEYEALMFELALPDDNDNVPVTKVRVDNVSQEIVLAVRAIQSPPDMQMTIVRVDEVGAVHKEIGPLTFRMNDAEWDALVVSASLGYEADYLNELAIKDHFDPTIFPGLFT